MESELDVGQTVHVKVVDVRHDVRSRRRRDPSSVVIEFEVLDEGPHLGEHLLGKPDRRVWDWIATLLGYSRSFVGPQVRLDRILNHSCRAVIGVSGHHRAEPVVKDVLPA